MDFTIIRVMTILGSYAQIRLSDWEAGKEYLPVPGTERIIKRTNIVPRCIAEAFED